MTQLQGVRRVEVGDYYTERTDDGLGFYRTEATEPGYEIRIKLVGTIFIPLRLIREANSARLPEPQTQPSDGKVQKARGSKASR